MDKEEYESCLSSAGEVKRFIFKGPQDVRVTQEYETLFSLAEEVKKFVLKKTQDVREVVVAESGPNSRKPPVSLAMKKIDYFNRTRRIKKIETKLMATNKNIMTKTEPSGLLQALLKSPQETDVRLVICDIDNDDDKTVRKRFEETADIDMKIKYMMRIENPYTTASYLLKMKELRIRSKKKLTERIMFHGTNKSNINSICKYNLNWRLAGKLNGTEMGFGTALCSNSHLAANYCDVETDKCMIVGKVITSPSCNGMNFIYSDMNENMKVPKFVKGKDSNLTIVKLHDDEFLPTHIIHFQQQDKTKIPIQKGEMVKMASGMKNIGVEKAVEAREIEPRVYKDPPRSTKKMRTPKKYSFRRICALIRRSGGKPSIKERRFVLASSPHSNIGYYRNIPVKLF